MKRALSLLLVLCCLWGWGLAEEETFLSVTGLEDMRDKLASGVTIVSAYYSDGYGFSDRGFLTQDPEECRALFDTLCGLKLLKKTNESITDWYPLILFTLSDESRYGVRFEGPWLDRGEEGNWEVADIETFYTLTDELNQKYAGQEPADSEPETKFLPNSVDLYFPGDGWSVSLSEGTVVSAEAFFEQSASGGRTRVHLEGICEGGEAVTVRREDGESAVIYLRVDEDNNVLIWSMEMSR